MGLWVLTNTPYFQPDTAIENVLLTSANFHKLPADNVFLSSYICYNVECNWVNVFADL